MEHAGCFSFGCGGSPAAAALARALSIGQLLLRELGNGAVAAALGHTQLQSMGSIAATARVRAPRTLVNAGYAGTSPQARADPHAFPHRRAAPHLRGLA